MKRNKLIVVLIILASTIVAGCATAPKHPALEQADLPDLIPVRNFFLSGKTNYDYKISPDGKKLAWIAPKNFRRTIFFRTVGQNDTKAIDPHSGRSIYNHHWLQDSRRLLYMQDQEGNENHHIYLVDTLHPDQKPVDLTPYSNTRAGIHQIIRSDPDHILIVHNQRDKTVFDLYRINLGTHQQTLLAQNPGDVASWITDQEGDLRARVKKNQPDNLALELFHPQHQTWKTLITWDFNDSVRILGFTPDDRGLWLLSNRGRDRINLVRLNLETGKEALIYADQQVDVAGVMLSELTKKPMWAFSCPDYPKIHFFDSMLEAEFEELQQKKPMGLSIKSMDHQERQFTYSLYDDNGTAHYLIDRETGAKKFLGRAKYSQALLALVPPPNVDLILVCARSLHAATTNSTTFGRQDRRSVISNILPRLSNTAACNAPSPLISPPYQICHLFDDSLGESN